jgi:dTDP-4-dehydrorhamnose 3,5-epimerase
MLHGVVVEPLHQIKDERGRVMHMLRRDSALFEQFGEIYFSVTKPGAVKAWRRHQKMTLNYAVPMGQIKLVLYDDRPDSPTAGQLQELFIGRDNYALVKIPPNIWYGFQGLGDSETLLANCATLPYDPDEIIRCDPDDGRIPYNWGN